MNRLTNRQSLRPSFEEVLSLPVRAASTDTGRINTIILNSMKVYIKSLNLDPGSDDTTATFYFDMFTQSQGDYQTSCTITGSRSPEDIFAAVKASVITQALSQWSLTVADTDIVFNYPGYADTPGVVRTTSTLSLSLVGTGATGTQISATKDSSVKLNVSTSTTSTIGGPSTSAVALKICSTNNATEGSWTTVATVENDQTITLAIALNSIQVVKGQLSTDVPAGWYAKLVNSGSGTHSESFVSGQKTIYG